MGDDSSKTQSPTRKFLEKLSKIPHEPLVPPSDVVHLSSGTSVRIATFNVENLFARFKFRETPSGNPYSGNGSPFIEHMHSGSNMNHRETLSNSVDVLGFTRDDLVIDVHDSTEKKLTAEVIQGMDADILCIQEVESLSLLDKFCSKYLRQCGYKYSMLIDAHDPRGINVAVLSRHPIKRSISYKDEKESDALKLMSPLSKLAFKEALNSMGKEVINNTPAGPLPQSLADQQPPLSSSSSSSPFFGPKLNSASIAGQYRQPRKISAHSPSHSTPKSKVLSSNTKIIQVQSDDDIEDNLIQPIRNSDKIILSKLKEQSAGNADSNLLDGEEDNTLKAPSAPLSNMYDIQQDDESMSNFELDGVLSDNNAPIKRPSLKSNLSEEPSKNKKRLCYLSNNGNKEIQVEFKDENDPSLSKPTASPRNLNSPIQFSLQPQSPPSPCYQPKERQIDTIYLFSRDCLAVEIDVEGTPLYVYVNHLKSMSKGRDSTSAKRALQCSRICQILDCMWLQNHYSSNIVIVGDFNDFPSYGTSLCSLLGNTHLQELISSTLPRNEKWTHHYAVENSYQQLDYFLVSRLLAEANPHAKPNIIRCGLPFRASKLGNDVPRLAGIGENRPKASDHCAVFVDLFLLKKDLNNTVKELVKDRKIDSCKVKLGGAYLRDAILALAENEIHKSSTQHGDSKYKLTSDRPIKNELEAFACSPQNNHLRKSQKMSFMQWLRLFPMVWDQRLNSKNEISSDIELESNKLRQELPTKNMSMSSLPSWPTPSVFVLNWARHTARYAIGDGCELQAMQQKKGFLSHISSGALYQSPFGKTESEICDIREKTFQSVWYGAGLAFGNVMPRPLWAINLGMEWITSMRNSIENNF